MTIGFGHLIQVFTCDRRGMESKSKKNRHYQIEKKEIQKTKTLKNDQMQGRCFEMCPTSEIAL